MAAQAGWPSICKSLASMRSTMSTSSSLVTASCMAETPEVPCTLKALWPFQAGGKAATTVTPTETDQARAERCIMGVVESRWCVCV